MNNLRLAVLPALLAISLSGCRTLALPDWHHPGTAQYQQGIAEQFDPYPENEPAPAVVGGRPLSYEKPPPEVRRARWLPWNWHWR